MTHPAAEALAVYRPDLDHEPAMVVITTGAAVHDAVPAVDEGETLCAALEGYRAFASRYIAFPSEHEAVALALWVAHAHLVDEFETSPILAITSAEMRSGKTRTLDCLEVMVPDPFRCVIPSEAVVYTVLSQRPRRTMLLDEADAIFSSRTSERYEGLRAILNAGNRQGTPVLRVKLDGRRREVEAFDVYGPKAIAGIGKLPDTVADRAIPIRLKRRAPTEIVAKFRRRTAEAEAKKIPRIGAVSLPDLAEVDVPDELHDRAADAWEPLLAIADAAGGDWPQMARLAATALSADEDSEPSFGMRLLADIRDIFDTRASDHLSTQDLLDGLHELDDAPWGEYYGKPLTARGLAKLLEPYRILPAQRRIAGGKHRGYFRQAFGDAWARYAPASGASPSSADEPDASLGLFDPVPLVPDVPVRVGRTDTPVSRTSGDGGPAEDNEAEVTGPLALGDFTHPSKEFPHA